MEKLSLSKFQDVEIKSAQMSNVAGGKLAATNSKSSCHCHTNPSWYESDEQTDFYGDNGEYIGSSSSTYNAFTQVSTYESW